MPNSIHILSTPMLGRIADRIRYAYIEDTFGLKGTEDAYFETAERILKAEIRDVWLADSLCEQLVAAGIGLCAIDANHREEILPTLESINDSNSRPQPLGLLALVRKIAGDLIWLSLKDEIQRMRKERGEAE